ncbi:hypothetical protein [Streptomyces melanogenes]|uniref:Uncharacterized protein n=1 Tax=Streptomyces melanogenes TaxID=67326 RepID=A0ABZ1XMZ7_9ACTN|nr:hypothetical protein [Streptomyces melanogenes]
MGFDEEWASSKAAAQQPVSTRLDGAYDGPFPPSPGGDKDLNSSPARKKAAANDIETDFEPNTRRAGVWADEASIAAGKAFGGWATADGLTKVQETWWKSVTALLGRLAGEKSALRDTNKLFFTNDIGVGGDFAPLTKPSQLNQISPPQP